MNIVLFTEIFDCGGIDTFIINLISKWPDKNDKFTLIANRDYPGLKIIENKLNFKIKIYKYNLSSYLNPNQKKTRLNKIAYPFLKYIKLFYNVFALKKIISNPEFDFLIVVNGGYPGGDMCRSAAISWALFKSDKPKSIHNFHNLVVGSPFFLLPFEILIDKLVSFSTSIFITVSDAAKNSILNRRHLCKSHTIFIYNGISNYSVPIKGNLKNELKLDSKIQICLMLATYETRKGHYFLLKAFKLVHQINSNVRLVMCGFGSKDEISRVNEYIFELDLTSCVYIFNFRRDKEYLISNSDVVVIASQEYESFGLTAIEAMSFKKPIVSTDVGGLPEVIGYNDGGFCISKIDTILFAERILLLLEDKDLYINMSEKGYNRFINNFTSERMAQKYYDTIQQLHI